MPEGSHPRHLPDLVGSSLSLPLFAVTLKSYTFELRIPLLFLCGLFCTIFLGKSTPCPLPGTGCQGCRRGDSTHPEP